VEATIQNAAGVDKGVVPGSRYGMGPRLFSGTRQVMRVGGGALDYCTGEAQQGSNGSEQDPTGTERQRVDRFSRSKQSGK